METRINKIIKFHWQHMVDDLFFYRGMSLDDLNLDSKIILDPNKNPHESFMPLYMEYGEFLLQMIKKGLEFHVKDFYIEPLQKVLGWTIRDIQNPGIDFTTNYADAAAYAFNYAGSQIKHNFNIITNTIHECEKQPCFNAEERQKLQKMTTMVQQILKTDKSSFHQPAVVKVRKSCPSFEDSENVELNIGSFDFFLKRIVQKAQAEKSFSIEKIAFFLHQKSQIGNFNIRLVKPLYKKDVVEIITL